MTAHEENEGPVEIEYLEEELQNLRCYEPCEDTDKDKNGPTRAWKMQRLKWREVRDPLLPEPEEFKPVTYSLAGEALRDRFKDTGLQVIVKMTSIELTPKNPVFPAGKWHVGDSRARHVADILELTWCVATRA